ncbi:lipase family protein [Candidatus Cardinium hertigii]|uniref:Fungal lipase-type domain-containing protein n=1 Tax=Candidatus Cardinium hertigii TaxID=247481 RepID=A0A2Z3L856_9BACT|nr:lipase family protein [Candidatus Cardinium hertigii]AWN81808.1 hypothetical protein DK880_00485 [Candidatus Cardinium hertigii]
MSPGRIFVLDGTNGKEIVIAYRGTQDRYDWRTNLQAAWQADVDFLSEQDGARTKAPWGYYQAFKDSRASLMNCLRQHVQHYGVSMKDLRVTVTGHSMGGAFAVISVLYLKTEAGIRDVAVVNFGSPKILNTTGSAMCERLIDKHNIIRAVSSDPVPYVISDYDLFYKHVGALQHINNGFSPMHKVNA